MTTVVVESSPGQVTITPELLARMLRQAGVVEGSRPGLLITMSRAEYDALAAEAGDLNSGAVTANLDEKCYSLRDFLAVIAAARLERHPIDAVVDRLLDMVAE